MQKFVERYLLWIEFIYTHNLIINEITIYIVKAPYTQRMPWNDLRVIRVANRYKSKRTVFFKNIRTQLQFKSNDRAYTRKVEYLSSYVTEHWTPGATTKKY